MEGKIVKIRVEAKELATKKSIKRSIKELIP